MTDRYDQLGPVARALVDGYDALDLAEMLVKAQDALATLRQVARGYCPDCGRGDAAPTVTDWEQQKQRADEAEGRLAHLQASSEAAGRFLTRTADERDRLRAVLAEILGQFQPLRPEHNPTGEPVDYQCRVLPYEWDAWQKAAAATEATGHQYLSTGCLHGQHGYCQSNTGLAGAKKPSRCKWCDAHCQCPCHTTTKEN